MDDAVLHWFLPGVVWWEFKCCAELLFVREVLLFCKFFLVSRAGRESFWICNHKCFYKVHWIFKKKSMEMSSNMCIWCMLSIFCMIRSSPHQLSSVKLSGSIFSKIHNWCWCHDCSGRRNVPIRSLNWAKVITACLSPWEHLTKMLTKTSFKYFEPITSMRGPSATFSGLCAHNARSLSYVWWLRLAPTGQSMQKSRDLPDGLEFVPSKLIMWLTDTLYPMPSWAWNGHAATE